MSTDQVDLEDKDVSTLLRLYRNSEARRQTAKGRIKYEEATQRSNQIERAIEDRLQRVEAERDRYEEVYSEIEEALFGDEEGRGVEAIINRAAQIRDEHTRLERALRRCVDVLEEAHDGKRCAAGRSALDLLAELESSGEDDG